MPNNCPGIAIISDDGRYRYRLERHMDGGFSAVALIMVNPSTADSLANDPTIVRGMGFAHRLGYSKLIVGNKCALRATDVKKLSRVTPFEAIGPDNDKHLEQIMRDADLHIVAWGPVAKLPPALRNRWQTVVRIADRVGCRLFCLGVAKDGHPRHPLMLPSTAPLVEWAAPFMLHRNRNVPPNSSATMEFVSQ